MCFYGIYIYFSEAVWVYLNAPRGRNHFYDDYLRMQADDECFVSLLTVDDMAHIDAKALERERKKKSKGLFLQEYYCSFDYGMEGAVYLDEMAALNKSGRYCRVPYDARFPVFVAWDIGYRDYTSIVFFQVDIGGQVRVIDHYQNNGEKLKHYADIIIGVIITIHHHRHLSIHEFPLEFRHYYF